MREVKVSKADVYSLLSAAQGVEKSMLELLTLNGLSIYDLYLMTWMDVDVEKMEITVWKVGKVPEARVIKVGTRTINRLGEIRAECRNQYFVFCERDGERYSPERIKWLLGHCMSVGGVVFREVGTEDVMKIDGCRAH